MSGDTFDAVPETRPDLCSFAAATSTAQNGKKRDTTRVSWAAGGSLLPDPSRPTRFSTTATPDRLSDIAWPWFTSLFSEHWKRLSRVQGYKPETLSSVIFQSQACAQTSDRRYLIRNLQVKTQRRSKTPAAC